MLSSGLNISKKRTPIPVTKRTLDAFAQTPDSDDDSSNQDLLKGRVQSLSSLQKFKVDDSDSTFDYDGVYDSMKSGERQAQKNKELEKKERKPKYMQSLFEMAEVRKRDRLRAEDVKLSREREAEGDEFADKEQFVTSAYRAQQEQLRLLESEEERRQQALRRKAGGFVAFNQNLLSKDEERHEEAVARSLQPVASRNTETSGELSQEIAERQKIKLAEAKLGHKIALNDDNQIVDHRQLLSAGLNRAIRSDQHLKTAELGTRAAPRHNEKDKVDRKAQIERQQRVIEDQLHATKKRQAEEASHKADQIWMQAKRTKTQAEVMSAKDRYLARKKAEAEAREIDCHTEPS